MQSQDSISYLLTYTYMFNGDYQTNHSETYDDKQQAIQRTRQIKQCKLIRNVKLFEVKHTEIDI